MSSMTLQEAADALGVHYMTAYRYVRLGLLHAEKIGGSWRVETADLDDFREYRNDGSGASARASVEIRAEFSIRPTRSDGP